MGKQLFSNNAATTLAAGIDAVVTSITVDDGSAFQEPKGTNYELATLTDDTLVEVVKITQRVGNTFTVVRGHEDTAKAWGAGAKFEARITADMLVSQLQSPLFVDHSLSRWVSRNTVADNSWKDVIWCKNTNLFGGSHAPGSFVAISITGTGDRAMMSFDGRKWWAGVTAADNSWQALAYDPALGSEGRLVAVGYTGVLNRAMTSDDGGWTWTIRVTPVDNSWFGVTWAAGISLFIAVSVTGTGDRVMTSPDGITWTSRTSAADNNWTRVVWSEELTLAVAVASSGVGNRVMTSPDGITWTIRTSAADYDWNDVAWSPELGLFCAVSDTGTDFMTSPDGTTWTLRSLPANDGQWHGITWSPEYGVFVAISRGSTEAIIMTSPDGVNWTLRIADDSSLRSHKKIAWSPARKIFCAVSDTGTGDRALTTL